MRVFSLVVLVVGVVAISGCPVAGSQCSKASDCGGTEAGGCASCPPSAKEYCEGGACKAAADKNMDLVVNLTARNQQILSIRFVVASFNQPKELSACAGKAGCAADVITCDDLRNTDWADGKFNVALSGAHGIDTTGGADTFNNGSLGRAPSSSHFVAIEGRSGTLGAGDRVSFACLPISSDMDLTLVRL